MKIDSKSLVFGMMAGVVIGSILFLVLTRSSLFGFTEQYTVTMKIKSDHSWWLNPQNNTRYPFGVVAVFVRNNVSAGEYEIWYSPNTNITLQKGDYTLNLYQGKTGLYIKTLQIYVAKDIEIEV